MSLISSLTSDPIHKKRFHKLILIQKKSNYNVDFFVWNHFSHESTTIESLKIQSGFRCDQNNINYNEYSFEGMLKQTAK